MKGQVLDFSVQKNEGIISVADDKEKNGPFGFFR